MKRQIYKIDKNGYAVETLVAEFDENGNCIEELTGNIITIDPPNGLYRAKWTGIEWVEDMSKVDIDALNNIPAPPTIENRVTNTEIDVVTLEETIDTIFGGM